MSIDTHSAGKLLNDVQAAHRIVVGFYERLFPRLDHIAEAMEFEFSYWRPLYTSRPAMSTTRPSKNWLWDMVPLYASRHVYRRVLGGGLNANDKAIVFDVHTDDGFALARKRGKPDPLSFEPGEANLQIDLYRATGESEEPFDAVWNKAAEAHRGRDGWHKVDDLIEGCSLKIPLEQFISDQELTGKTIRKLFFPDTGA